MAYDSKSFDLAQYFLGSEGDDGDEMQASLAQTIQDAVEGWFDGRQRPALIEPLRGTMRVGLLIDGKMYHPDDVARAVRAATTTCPTCSGRYEVGWFDHAEGAWRNEPCPVCSPCLSLAEQKAQASRCPCHGSDDMCPCQNAPDANTRAERKWDQP